MPKRTPKPNVLPKVSHPTPLYKPKINQESMKDKILNAGGLNFMLVKTMYESHFKELIT